MNYTETYLWGIVFGFFISIIIVYINFQKVDNKINDRINALNQSIIHSNQSKLNISEKDISNYLKKGVNQK